MYKFYCLISIFFFIHVNHYSQDTSSFEDKMKMEVKSNNYSWGYRNFFLDIKTTFGTEFFISPQKIVPALKYSYPGDISPDTVHFTDAEFLFNIAGITLEPRINLYNGSKISCFIKSPTSFNFSVTIANKNDIQGNGVFHATIPLLIGISSGLNSNYKNIDDFGFSISAGVQYLRTPLFGGNIYDYYHNYKPLSSNYSFDLRKNWFLPLIQLDYYYLNKKNKIRGVAFSFSVNKATYFKFSIFTSPLIKK